MENNFEKEVDIFINKLVAFDKSIFKRNIFNPWAESDKTDISLDAYKIRVNNLKQYLISKQNSKYILIAESPSTGARYSGIAMTSEKVIKELKLNFEFSSLKSSEGKPVYELTAKKVWNETIKSDKNFVMWNAFAFNIHEKEKKWFENPTEEELLKNLYLLQTFLRLYPNAKMITIGTTAKNALNILKFTDFDCIRHPSNDFKKEFPIQFSKYL